MPMATVRLCQVATARHNSDVVLTAEKSNQDVAPSEFASRTAQRARQEALKAPNAIKRVWVVIGKLSINELQLHRQRSASSSFTNLQASGAT